jgi:Ni,Fe-hydrogenase maturation factor
MKRWKALRERFARENKKKKKSGDSADTTHDWPLFSLLLFLKEFIKHRK